MRYNFAIKDDKIVAVADNDNGQWFHIGDVVKLMDKAIKTAFQDGVGARIQKIIKSEDDAFVESILQLSLSKYIDGLEKKGKSDN